MRRPTQRLARILLWTDSLAALGAGIAVLWLHTRLFTLYNLPPGLIVLMGQVNLAYGIFSGALALTTTLRGSVRRGWITALVIANMTWVGVCLALGVLTAPFATPLGLTHLFVEAAFVCALALAEYRFVRPLAR